MVRRRNKLEGLKGDDGIWRSDKDSMMSTVISYFNNLFLEQPNALLYDNLPQYFPRLLDSDTAVLSREVSEEEVKAGLFTIGGFKAPGLDGFSAIFFQDQWKVCREDFVKLVVDSFNTRFFPVVLNQTLISLVPT